MGVLSAVLAASILLIVASPVVTLATKHDKNLIIKPDYSSSVLRLTCPNGSSLDSLRKQPFKESKLFRGLNVSGCPPDNSSYWSVLDNLNATLMGSGALKVILPASGQPLAARHLHGLELAKLHLISYSKRRSPAGVATDLLAGQRALGTLVVRNVPMSEDALAAASDGLKSLVLQDAGTHRVPPALLAHLEMLSVKSESPVDLESRAPVLRELVLLSAGLASTRTNWTLYPNLTTLSLTEWRGSPEPWIGCGSLQDLTITRSTMTTLPARWLGTCCALRELKVYYACRLDVSALPESLLEGCGTRDALVKLELRNSAASVAGCSGISAGAADARQMPAVFGAGVAPNLRELDLSCNNLASLDRRLFVNLKSLEILDLSYNRFDKSIYNLMSSLRSLKKLGLSSNKFLGDACEGSKYEPSGSSPLQNLTQLRVLYLSDTGVSLICQDWREELRRLKTLKLDRTNITHLSMRDLRFWRADDLDAEVSLLGTRVSSVHYSVRDVRRVLDGSLRSSRARVQLSSKLDCDCHMYNARYAWNMDTKHVTFGVNKPMCNTVGGKNLRRVVDQVPLESMVCPCATNYVMPGCECWVRPLYKPKARVVLRANLTCKGLGLSALPNELYAFNSTEYGETPPAVEWELYFRNNSIVELKALPRARETHVIKILDLRYNKLRRVSPEAAEALAAGADSGDNRLEELQLGGNELQCNCGAGPLLAAVAALSVSGTKLGDARCGGTDTRTLVNASVEVARQCVAEPASAGGVTLGITLGSVVAAIALAALAVSVALARPSRRAQLKGILLDWGWLPRPDDANAHSFDYDAFVSFVMADLEFVNEMAAQLETGAAPLRLCLHHRDWPPGEFVPAQIANSVRRSRRTVAVVSHHFLASEWVRAEFYEALAAGARDGTPRLVVVLLEDPRELRLGRGLRHYVANNTYLYRDNPQFWTLLRKAVQAPPSPSAAPVPASGPSPAESIEDTSSSGASSVDGAATLTPTAAAGSAMVSVC